MGALQSGLPNPTMVPENWHVIVIYLKDCFSTIPLVFTDREKFAFSVPSINNSKPMEWIQWKVLPQVMINSPTICQYYVHHAIKLVRKIFPAIYFYHYMDDILLAASTPKELNQAYAMLQETLK